MQQSNIEYYVSDIETTGFKDGFHEITEVCFIRCSDLHELHRFVKIKHPQRVSPRALTATGRTMADLKKGEPFDKVVSQVDNFFNQDGKTARHRCIITHNNSFDKRFLKAMWKSAGREFQAEMWFETKKLSKLWAIKMGKKWPSNKLQDILDYTSTRLYKKAHTAQHDARNLYMFWKKGMEAGINKLDCIERDGD